jgi:hypothetical protein
LRGAEYSVLFVIILHTIQGSLKSLGDWSDGGTPGNIPNPAVKAVSADGTCGAAPWESRSLPRGFFCLICSFSIKIEAL